MKLEDQVCSLELAKRLKELGVKQNSLFYWVLPCQSHGMIPTTLVYKDENTYWRKNWNQDWVFAAFTVAELGEMLPMFGPQMSHLQIIKTWNAFKTEVWSVSYVMTLTVEVFQEENFSDAVAKMLIHLIEKGIVKP